MTSPRRTREELGLWLGPPSSSYSCARPLRARPGPGPRARAAPGALQAVPLAPGFSSGPAAASHGCPQLLAPLRSAVPQPRPGRRAPAPAPAPRRRPCPLAGSSEDGRVAVPAARPHQRPEPGGFRGHVSPRDQLCSCCFSSPAWAGPAACSWA